MNEELLRAIYTNEGFEAKGIPYEKFKNDIQNPELQRAIHVNAGFKEKGISFDKFQRDLGMDAEPVDGVEPLPLGFLEDTKVGNFIQSTYNAAARGLASGAGVDNAIEVLAKGANSTNEDISDFVDSVTNQQKYGISEELRDFNEAEGFGNSWNAFWKAPVKILSEIVTESAFAMGRVGGIAIAGSALTPAAPVLVPFSLFATSAALTTAGTMVEEMQTMLAEKGLDFNKANLREVFDDEDAWEELRNRSIVKGAVVGLVDGATAGIVTKMGGSSLVSKLASKGASGEAITSGTIRATKLATRARQFAVEGGSGFLGEVGGQVASGQDLDIKGGLIEVIAEAPGAVVSVATSSVINKARMGTLTEKEMANAVVAIDENQFNGAVDVAQRMGHVSEDQANQLKGSFNGLVELDKTIPRSVGNKIKRAAILNKIQERKKIDEEIQATNEVAVDEVFENEKKQRLDDLEKQRNQNVKETKDIINDKKPIEDAEETGTVREEGSKEEGDEVRLGNLQEQSEQENKAQAEAEKEEEEVRFVPDSELQNKEKVTLNVRNESGAFETVSEDPVVAQNTIRDQLNKLRRLRDCL